MQKVQIERGEIKVRYCEKFFTMTVVRHHRTDWPREAVDAPTMKVFQAKFDRAWKNLVTWRCPAHGKGVATT